MHARSYRGLMQTHGAFFFLRYSANQSATSLSNFFPLMYSTIFVSHDGEELPGVSDARMVQIFLRICHFGLEETNVSFSIIDFPLCISSIFLSRRSHRCYVLKLIPLK
jgi:hypothetical protein